MLIKFAYNRPGYTAKWGNTKIALLKYVNTILQNKYIFVKKKIKII